MPRKIETTPEQKRPRMGAADEFQLACPTGVRTHRRTHLFPTEEVRPRRPVLKFEIRRRGAHSLLFAHSFARHPPATRTFAGCRGRMFFIHEIIFVEDRRCVCEGCQHGKVTESVNRETHWRGRKTFRFVTKIRRQQERENWTDDPKRSRFHEKFLS